MTRSPLLRTLALCSAATIGLGLFVLGAVPPVTAHAATTADIAGTTVAAPDLQITKTLQSNGPNGVVVFGLVIKNIGTTTAPAPITFKDVLQAGYPAGTLITGISGQGPATCSALPATSVSCTASGSGSTIPANGGGWSMIFITITVPPAGGSFKNCGEVRFTSPANVESNLGNNQACVDVVVKPYGAGGPDLSAVKTATLGVNGSITYVITVKNNGTVAAPLPVTVNDALVAGGFPAGTTFTGAGGTGGFSCPAPGAPAWTCTSNTVLGVNASYTLVISAKVPPAGGIVANCATVSFPTVPATSGDPTPTNNTSCVKNDVPPYSAFSCTGQGYVTTGNTGSPMKCWSPISTAVLTWSQANAYCSGLANGPWRLPTEAELKNLYNTYLLTNNPPWPGLTLDWVLSSTPSTPGNHVAVNLLKGYPPNSGASTPAADVTAFAHTCVKP